MANLEDVQDLIQEILDNPKLKHVADRLRQEYHDEPILQTASQMQRLLPRPLVEAKRLMRNPAEYHYSYRQLFYQQAKLLEDFTDDFSEQTSFSSCYPCYRDMNDRQLRTYFTWRTKVRQGVVESTSPSYAELYCYELLHQIGVPDPETGFRMLQQFRQDYTAVSPECRFPYFSIWLHDYIIYYGLDQALLPELSEDYAAGARFDKSFQTVQEAETHTDAELFQAISDLSGYGLQRSKFYREQTELIEQAVPYCFRQMCDYFRNRKKSDYLEYLFGKKGLLPYHMFNYATFFETDPERNCDYVLSPYHIYRCRSGKWTCEAYFDAEKGKKRLGCFVKTIDQKLRQLVQYPHPIKETELPKYLQQVLDKTLAAFLDERKKNAVPKVEFDLSRLAGIRQAAKVTRDKLLVDTEEEPKLQAAPKPAPELPVPETTPAEPAAPETPAADTRLSETERAFLHCLLEHQPYADLLRQGGVMLSVLVDHINETLFDDFGDTVILFDGDQPELIEDYVEELRALLG